MIAFFRLLLRLLLLLSSSALSGAAAAAAAALSAAPSPDGAALCLLVVVRCLPVALACVLGPWQAIRLIEGGETDLDAGDKGGQTPIHIACYRVSQK